MADYLIVAQDKFWYGGFGMEEWRIVNCENEQQAFSIAREMSLDIIDSDSDACATFRDNAEYWADMKEEEGEEFNREDYIEAAIEQQREDNIYFMCWRLSDRFDYSKITSENDDWRDIVENYAEEEF